MHLRFIWPGKTKDERLRSLASEYLKRLSRFARCELTEVRESTTRDATAVEKEQRRIAEAIPSGSLVVLLDVNGREWSSKELAAQVQELLPDAVLLNVDEVCAAQQRSAVQLSDIPADAEAAVEDLFAEYIRATGVHGSTAAHVLETFKLLHEGGDLPELHAPAKEPSAHAEVAAS